MVESRDKRNGDMPVPTAGRNEDDLGPVPPRILELAHKLQQAIAATRPKRADSSAEAAEIAEAERSGKIQ